MAVGIDKDGRDDIFGLFNWPDSMGDECEDKSLVLGPRFCKRKVVDSFRKFGGFDVGIGQG